MREGCVSGVEKQDCRGRGVVYLFTFHVRGALAWEKKKKKEKNLLWCGSLPSLSLHLSNDLCDFIMHFIT